LSAGGILHSLSHPAHTMRVESIYMKRVLFYFPQKPYPPQTGAHKRCLQLLEGLKALDCKIRYASSAYRNSAWTEAAEQELRQYIGCDISIFRPTLIQRGISAGFDYVRKIKCSGISRPQHLTIYHARSWFSKIATDFEPEVLVINYANNDTLVDWKIYHFSNSIIEMHDLISVNKKMKLDMIKDVGEHAIITGTNINKILDLDYFNRKAYSAEESEFRVYDKYKYTTCISENEKDDVSSHTRITRAVHIPMTHEAQYIANNYEGEALFCGGPNVFNNQGYYFFVNKVLPLILIARSDFRMNVTGYFYENCQPMVVNRVKYLGFVDDLKPLYSSARIFICPVFGGTGQQVKIVEAMAHGLPVVAFASAAKRSPLRHGENGLIAHTAEEFAEHVITLWCNKKLCSQLGEGARSTIASEYNQDRLLGKLTSLVR
jgi:glycosyltransferase involved in cell wall biosynthesis